MALARRYDSDRKAITSSIYDGYMDRVSRHSDIQEYLPVLYGWATLYEKPRILELGARRGNSTLAFLAGAQKSGGHVWSVDIDDVLQYRDGMKPWQHTPEWTFIQGDDLAPETQAKLPAEVDILFVDSCHEYEHVRAELFDYMPRLAADGIALFHDTRLMDWPGYKPPNGIPPVKQALDEYCEKTGLEWQDLPGKYGLGVIQLGSEREAVEAIVNG